MEAQLDTIEANPNVKQWTCNFGYISIPEYVKERLRKIIIDRNDNSLFLENYKGKIDIAQITQQFRISPVSYC